MTHADRTVHGKTASGHEIVRYDRAGKWYLEASGDRRRITLVEAVTFATNPGSTVKYYRSGGRRFDAMVRAVKVRV